MCEGMTEEEFVIYGEETDSIYIYVCVRAVPLGVKA